MPYVPTAEGIAAALQAATNMSEIAVNPTNSMLLSIQDGNLAPAAYIDAVLGATVVGVSSLTGTSPIIVSSPTGAVTVSLATQGGLTPGSYINSDITVNSNGIITAISNGADGYTGTVTSVATNSTLSGGPITTSGTLSLNLSNANTWLATQSFTAPIINTAGPNSGQQHTLPAVSSDTFALLAASQTLTNKTLTNVVINGATSSSGNFDLSGSSGTFKTPGSTSTFGGSSNLFTNQVTIKPATNQLILGGVSGGTFVTISSVAPSPSSYTLTIPDTGGADTFAFLAATQTLTNKTLTAPVINGATSASGNFNLSGSTGTFLTTTGASTFGGSSNTFTNGIIVRPTTNQITLGASGHVAVISSTAPAAASNTLTIPDTGGNDTFAFVTLAQTLSNKTLASPVISGTITGTYNIGGTPTATSPILANLSTTVVNPAWINFTYTNSWADYSGTGSSAYTKDALGRVNVRINAKDGTASSSITTLPTGYLPGLPRLIPCVYKDGNGDYFVGIILISILGGISPFNFSDTAGVFIEFSYYAEG